MYSELRRLAKRLDDLMVVEMILRSLDLDGQAELIELLSKSESERDVRVRILRDRDGRVVRDEKGRIILEVSWPFSLTQRLG